MAGDDAPQHDGMEVDVEESSAPVYSVGFTFLLPRGLRAAGRPAHLRASSRRAFARLPLGRARQGALSWATAPAHPMLVWACG
jgi:hypothetical protein